MSDTVAASTTAVDLGGLSIASLPRTASERGGRERVRSNVDGSTDPMSEDREWIGCGSATDERTERGVCWHQGFLNRDPSAPDAERRTYHRR